MYPCYLRFLIRNMLFTYVIGQNCCYSKLEVVLATIESGISRILMPTTCRLIKNRSLFYSLH